jgi:hypothetical protein
MFVYDVSVTVVRIGMRNTLSSIQFFSELSCYPEQCLEVFYIHKSRIRHHGTYLSVDSKSHLVMEDRFSPSWTKTAYLGVHNSLIVAVGTLLRAR